MKRGKTWWRKICKVNIERKTERKNVEIKG